MRFRQDGGFEIGERIPLSERDHLCGRDSSCLRLARSRMRLQHICRRDVAPADRRIEKPAK